MADFVKRGSIVRRIWGDGDMVMLVFAGSAAEFALNRAVDWLLFTGELPEWKADRALHLRRDLRPALRFYPLLARAGLRPIMHRLLVPPMYLSAVRALDHERAGAIAAPRSSP